LYGKTLKTGKNRDDPRGGFGVAILHIDKGVKMLTFAKGKISGSRLQGDISQSWLYCPVCLSCLTHKDIKVNINGVAHCARCASEYYQDKALQD
jgi:hypothetical protein|tara:strand:- start:1723 stop:2004 length:282 start_codon:yes stop_codon:yes gene_type:complete